jgi:phosphonate transport system substrate-binding protein
MKRIVPVVIAAALVGVVAAPGMAAAKPTSGAACKTVGQKSGTLSCGANKKWAATSAPTSAAPAPAASVAATVAPTAAPTTVAAAPAATVVAKNPTKLVFAPVPAENAVVTASNWAPFVKALSDRIGIPIEQVASTDYAGVTEGVLAGKVDIASYGPLSYYIAVQAGAKIRGVAISASSFGAPATYQSYLFTKANRSDINSIADVKGKKVCFGDPESTSGTLYPYLMLADANIDSQKDITNVVAGAHDKSILGVVNGQCDAGFAFDTIVETPSGAASAVKSTDIKIIQKSKPIPNSPIAVRSDLPPALFKQLSEVIPDIDALYLQGKGYCPSTAPKCGPGVLNGTNNGSWKAQLNDDWMAPITAACKLQGAPNSCRPAKK